MLILTYYGFAIKIVGRDNYLCTLETLIKTTLTIWDTQSGILRKCCLIISKKTEDKCDEYFYGGRGKKVFPEEVGISQAQQSQSQCSVKRKKMELETSNFEHGTRNSELFSFQYQSQLAEREVAVSSEESRSRSLSWQRKKTPLRFSRPQRGHLKKKIQSQ